MTLPRPRHLKHFLNLPSDQRYGLAGALVLIPAFAAGIRVLGFRRCYAWVGEPSTKLDSRLRGNDDEARTGLHYARLVYWAARYGLWRGNCLSQSLALLRLLRGRAINAQLRIGVRRTAAEMEAHAWVELNGMPLNDTPDVAQRYAPFASLAELPAATFV